MEWGYIRNSYLMVDVFFVLSGFVIFYAYHARLRTKPEFERFMWLRFWRIYPLHFTFLMVLLGIEFLKLLGSLHGMSTAHPPFVENGALAFLSNLLLLQGLGTTTSLTFNDPSWSISTEFLAYLLFAGVTFFARTPRVILACCVILCISGLAGLIALGPLSVTMTYDFGMLRCIVGFFLGCLTYAAFDALRTRSVVAEKSGWIGIAAVVLIVAFVFELSYSKPGYGDLVIYPLSASIILLVALSPNSSMTRPLYSRALQWLGTTSYSIYMVHFSVVWLVRNALRLSTHAYDASNSYGSPMLMTGPVIGTIALAFTVAAVLLLSHVTYTRIELPFREWSRHKRFHL